MSAITATFDATLDRQLAALTRSRIWNAALTALIGLGAAYLILTWDSTGSVSEALSTSSRFDIDLAIAVVAFFLLHGIHHWKADSREIRSLHLHRAGAASKP